ncbi:hypothetical protein [Elioraea sp.]|uniref:hypothetical protein n=1 Tax=Elioraea sp. TaxID=2185103 RepID=UPI00307F89FF
MQAVPVLIELVQAKPEERIEALRAVLYDRTGRAAAETILKVEAEGGRLIARGELTIDAKRIGDSARLLVAPVIESGKRAAPDRAALLRQLRGHLETVRLDPRRPDIRILIPRPVWWPWFKLCACWVRGRLVKRVVLPNGTTRDLPICHARVTLCEIDRWPRLIRALPDRDILRLRDELLEAIRRPIPLPDPPPFAFPGPFPDLPPSPDPASLPPRAAPAAQVPARAAPRPAEAGPHAAPVFRLVEEIEHAPLEAVRARLGLAGALLFPYLCRFGWLDALFVTHRHCFATVTTDDEGRFSALYIHACGDEDRPDIYISAQQLLGGVWTTIHAPPVTCGTTWNYHCGDEITVVVTDPRAQACVPDDPVDPPPGVETWVMPHAVGAMPIAGTAGVAPGPGWVRPDGLADHGANADAPFGAVLGFRQQHALSIPSDAIYYFRWSWRRGSSGAWTAMSTPITRSYVRDVPGPAVQFPTVQLGPVGDNLFRFRTQLFNPAEWGVDTSADPAGTTYYWPIDSGMGEIYAAKWTTPGTADAAAAPALAGLYQVRLEVFSKTGTRVAPGPDTFRFIVPTGIAADGTLSTRLADASEIIEDGFVFSLVIDNARCTASIAAPVISAGEADDDCGFIRYAAGASVTLAFAPAHPNGRARFSFGLSRGATPVAAAGASGEVVAATAGAYARAGTTFSGSFAVGALMGTCPNAAFAETLYVAAKATDGTTRLSGYDASAVRAFALAQQG